MAANQPFPGAGGPHPVTDRDPCPACEGTGDDYWGDERVACPACNGSGVAKAPAAPPDFRFCPRCSNLSAFVDGGELLCLDCTGAGGTPKPDAVDAADAEAAAEPGSALPCWGCDGTGRHPDDPEKPCDFCEGGGTLAVPPPGSDRPTRS